MKAFAENKADRLFLEGKVESKTLVSFTVKNRLKSVSILLKRSNVIQEDVVLILAYLFDQNPNPTKGECFPTFQ